MRILHVTNNYTPYNGGVVHAIENIIESQKIDHTVGLVTFDFKQKEPIKDHPHIYRIWSPIHFTYKQNPMILPYNIFDQLSHIILHFKPTIIHTHHPFLLGKAAQKIAKIIACPIVFTYHTWYQYYLHYCPCKIQKIIPSLEHYFIERLIDTFCQSVDGIIAPSNAVYTYLKQKNPHYRVITIPSPINNRFFNKVVSKPICNNRKIRLLSISRFVPEKNLFALFDICKKLDITKYELIIAGFGYLEKELKKTAYNDYQFPKASVTFISHPSPATIDRLYDWADLFIFTSTTDTQGLVLAEALARAVPIISLEGPGQKDIITHGYNGFYCQNTDQIARMIKDIYNNKYSLKKLRINGLQIAKNYSQKTIYKKTIDWYKKIVM